MPASPGRTVPGAIGNELKTARLTSVTLIVTGLCALRGRVGRRRRSPSRSPAPARRQREPQRVTLHGTSAATSHDTVDAFTTAERHRQRTRSPDSAQPAPAFPITPSRRSGVGIDGARLERAVAVVDPGLEPDDVAVRQRVAQVPHRRELEPVGLVAAFGGTVRSSAPGCGVEPVIRSSRAAPRTPSWARLMPSTVNDAVLPSEKPVGLEDDGPRKRAKIALGEHREPSSSPSRGRERRRPTRTRTNSIGSPGRRDCGRIPTASAERRR